MWWVWCITGLVLLGLELIQPAGFFLFFLGVGAISTGLLLAVIGTGFAIWLPWALFSGLSIVFLILFRAKVRMLVARSSPQRAPELSGEIATVVGAEIIGRGNGTVELRGTQWQARNDSDVPLPVGARVRVTGVSGLTVSVVLDR